MYTVTYTLPPRLASPGRRSGRLRCVDLATAEREAASLRADGFTFVRVVTPAERAS